MIAKPSGNSLPVSTEPSHSKSLWWPSVYCADVRAKVLRTLLSFLRMISSFPDVMPLSLLRCRTRF